MNSLKKLNQAVEKIFEVIAGILVVGIMAIVCIQVISRNLFAFNIGSLADYPAYLMIFAVWIGAIVVAKTDEHLSIDLVETLTSNKKIQISVKIAMDLIAAVAFAIFAFYGFRQVGILYGRGQIESATKLPVWFLQSVIPFSAAFQSLYFFINTGKSVRRLTAK